MKNNPAIWSHCGQSPLCYINSFLFQGDQTQRGVVLTINSYKTLTRSTPTFNEYGDSKTILVRFSRLDSDTTRQVVDRSVVVPHNCHSPKIGMISMIIE